MMQYWATNIGGTWATPSSEDILAAVRECKQLMKPQFDVVLFDRYRYERFKAAVEPPAELPYSLPVMTIAGIPFEVYDTPDEFDDRCEQLTKMGKRVLACFEPPTQPATEE